MAKKATQVAIPDEVVMNKIYVIRGQKVMIDRDLAELYGVETRVLKQAVRRNMNRFPEDFMFEMDVQELEIWRSQFVISNEDKKGLRYAPFCFTEQGVTMLSCVLNSQQSIEINIRIVRIFTRMRELIMTHKDLLIELEKIRRSTDGNTKSIELLFEYMDGLMEKAEKPKKKPRIKKVGFKQQKKI